MKWFRTETGQTVVLIGITAMIALAMVWVNTYQRCRREFKQGEAYFEQDDYINAITAYETAIHAYTPFNSMIPQAASRLWEMALDREQAGDDDMALIALRSLRSSFYAVRSLYTPYPEWIQRSEERIAEIMKRKTAPAQLEKRWELNPPQVQ